MTKNKGNIKEVRNPDGTFAKGNMTGKLSTKGKHFTTKLREFIEKEGADEEIKQAILKKMRDGDFNFIKEYWQQIDGKPAQRNEITGADGKPLVVTFDNSFNNKE